MHLSRRTRAAVLLVLVALVAAACGGDDSSSSGNDGGDSAESTTTATPKDGGVVTMGTYIEPSGLDPVVAQGGGTGGNHGLKLNVTTTVMFDEAWIG